MKDFYGIDVEVGDIVSFPAGKELMDGTIEKIRKGKTPYWDQIYVNNTSGNKKWKNARDCINHSRINESAPQLFI